MSNIFCSQCGSKHSSGARFCSSCGSPLTAFASSSLRQPQRQPSCDTNVSEEIEELPALKKLDYEIQSDGNNVYKAEDLVNALPVEEADRLKRPIGKQKSMTKEEYLAKSLKECAATERHVIE